MTTPVRKVILLAVLLLVQGCLHQPQRQCGEAGLFSAAADSRQALVVTVKRQGNPSAVDIRRYERNGGCWQQYGASVEGMAGRNGIAPPGEKREGDGRTPSGTFTLERGFGYEPLATKLPFIVVDPGMVWIDDPKSPLYNMPARREDGEGLSYEEMKRNDDLYKYGIVIEYNTKNIVPGEGSAIFYHVWRDRETATAGCVATAENVLVEILHWLDPEKKPVTVIGHPQ